MALTGDAASRDATRLVYLSWVEGFLVGTDMATPDLKRKLSEGEVTWGLLLAYCRKNPEKSVIDGAIDILNSLPTETRR
jgi:hypothetical protein